MARASAVSFAILALAFSLGGTPAVAQVEVNTCGQTFSGKGFLSGDLDCTGFDGWAITIGRKGSLELRGFTISGGQATRRVVFCTKHCEIIGPGAIVGAAGSGVQANGRVRIRNVSISNNGTAVYALKVMLRDSTLADNSGGVSAEKSASIFNSMITGSARRGVEVQSLRGGAKARIVNSTITGNGGHGVSVSPKPRCPRCKLPPGRIIVRDSTITGNGLLPPCGVTSACADVASTSKPILLGTSTCDTSYLLGSGFPGVNWRVCDLD